MDHGIEKKKFSARPFDGITAERRQRGVLLSRVLFE
jgi:hypothetical protein